MKTHTLFLALMLLVALLSTASAAAVPRRMLLDEFSDCQNSCQKAFDEDHDGCINFVEHGPLPDHFPPSAAREYAEGRCRDRPVAKSALEQCKAACKPSMRATTVPASESGVQDAMPPVDVDTGKH